MAATICPTILASTSEEYEAQIKNVLDMCTRLHIDLTDGQFAKTDSVNINDVWWPGGVRADLHVMYQNPFEHLEAILALAPQLVIVHAEAEGLFEPFAKKLHHHGVETGLALLAETSVDNIEPALEWVDHVLVFSGDLGHFGGKADLKLLDKVRQLRQLKPSIEIGWDGGVNLDNAKALIDAGVDVLNVGGAIQKATDPAATYEALIQVTKA